MPHRRPLGPLAAALLVAATGALTGCSEEPPPPAGGDMSDNPPATQPTDAPVAPAPVTVRATLGKGSLEVKIVNGQATATVHANGQAGAPLQLAVPANGTRHLVCADEPTELCALTTRTGSAEAQAKVLTVDGTKLKELRTDKVLPVVGTFSDKGAVGLVSAIQKDASTLVLQVRGVTPTRTSVAGCVVPATPDKAGIDAAMPKGFSGLKAC